MEKKMNTTVEVLTKGFPSELASYINYTKSLRFEDRPDYGHLRRLFKELFMREKYEYDYVFDWSLKNQTAPPTSKSQTIVAEREQKYRRERETKGPT